MRQWRFPNTYCFSKHLAESLMASCHSTGFSVAIVRPSIIGGLAGTPLPGYVGNTAGSTGAALAIATGQSLPFTETHLLRWSAEHLHSVLVVTQSFIPAAQFPATGHL